MCVVDVHPVLCCYQNVLLASAVCHGWPRFILLLDGMEIFRVSLVDHSLDRIWQDLLASLNSHTHTQLDN